MDLNFVLERHPPKLGTPSVIPKTGGRPLGLLLPGTTPQNWGILQGKIKNGEIMLNDYGLTQAEAIILLLFKPEITKNPIIITATTADLMTWVSYDHCKDTLKSLVFYKYIEQVPNKARYYKITELGLERLKGLLKSHKIKQLKFHEKSITLDEYY